MKSARFNYLTAEQREKFNRKREKQVRAVERKRARQAKQRARLA